ncbi:MAG: NADP-dependent phosphogluconate dehydrogenase [Chloroflexota bacterium]
MSDCDIGIYGMAVMGQNLALNIADSGFKVAVSNRTDAKTRDFMAQKAGDRPLEAAYDDLSAFTSLIKKPRVVLLIVKAGAPVDAVIDQLLPHLEPGDILIDGGNSHYTDTERRIKALAEKDLHYVGMGISGGEEGARHGPSLMPGGTREAYERIKPIVEAVAASANGEPCAAYLGERGAGHYVKMVHNGIEYGVMQAIAEVYDVLHRGAGMTPHEISDVFARWNQGAMGSFLVDITAQILAVTDPETGAPLIEMILDRAEQKGTGKWTTQDALDMGVPVPTISTAVEARLISALKQEREQAAPHLPGPEAPFAGNRDDLIITLELALMSTMICCYAQGFAALRFASDEYDYNLDPEAIARIWRAGCIIRADLLEEIRGAYRQDRDLPNLMLGTYFKQFLGDSQNGWRAAVQTAVALGIPAPALSSALAYYDGYRSARLPANLIQAQRDYFGSHTYERTDRDGTFHTEWQSQQTE